MRACRGARSIATSRGLRLCATPPTALRSTKRGTPSATILAHPSTIDFTGLQGDARRRPRRPRSPALWWVRPSGWFGLRARPTERSHCAPAMRITCAGADPIRAGGRAALHRGRYTVVPKTWDTRHLIFDRSAPIRRRRLACGRSRAIGDADGLVSAARGRIDRRVACCDGRHLCACSAKRRCEDPERNGPGQ